VPGVLACLPSFDELRMASGCSFGCEFIHRSFFNRVKVRFALRSRNRGEAVLAPGDCYGVGDVVPAIWALLTQN
jgi:hypothetical protein